MPSPQVATLRKIRDGCSRAPGPGNPATALIAEAAVGGTQNVAATTEFCVPAMPVRTIGSRKQLRRPPPQTCPGMQSGQLGGLHSESIEQPRKVSVLQNWSNGPPSQTPSCGFGSDASGEQTTSLH